MTESFKIRAIVSIAPVVIVIVMGISASALAETYMFVPEASTVVKTGGFAGVHETYSIAGYFQLTVVFDAGSASFDSVDATLSDGTDLGQLFRMTTMIGTVVSDSKIEFVSSSLPGALHGAITLTLKKGCVLLKGRFSHPYPDGFTFDLDATAILASQIYHYFDDFSTEKAEQDSCIHSLFWPEGAFPPAEPYLSYHGSADRRALAFTDYRGQPAHLGYCFPLDPPEVSAVLTGTLEIDVRSPAGGQGLPCDIEASWSAPGYLLYTTSPDGADWSVPEPLGLGHHKIPIASAYGTCYVIFLGTSVSMDNLEVSLYSPPATICVPWDFDTIQEAIDFATDGDVIEVRPGTYTGKGNRDIEFRGKAITVRSSDGPERTIIDCGSPSEAVNSGKGHRGFYFHQGEGPQSVLRGFTIKGGRVPGSNMPTDNAEFNANASHSIGGGIYCEFSSPTIVDCVIKECGTEIGGGIGCVRSGAVIVDCVIESCTAGGFGPCESGGAGGGIALLRNCDAKISDCVIRENSCYYNSYGGGIYSLRSDVLIKRCDISSNSAPGSMEGGGLYCAGPSTRVVLQNCIISHNSANAGGGIFSTVGGLTPVDGIEAEGPRCYVRVTNCTVAHNRLSQPQMPPLPGGGIHSVGSDIIVKNSIVWYNEGTAVLLIDPACKSPVVYSDIEGGYLGQGNIDSPPLFAPTNVPDYHLQSIYGRYNPMTSKWVIDTNHSPCIDAGDPEDPLGHEPLPNGERINMGAYGGTRQASKGISCLVYHIDGINGDNSNNGLSKAQAFATIQKGVDSARDGDVVMVWPAIYNEEVDFLGKAIAVQSAADAAVVTASRGYAFSFFSSEGPDSVLRNFVITNSEYGIFCNGASPSITNLTIVDNGFGIAAYGGADPNVTNCILWSNASGDLFQCRARYSCIQEENRSEGQGNISKVPMFVDAEGGDYHLRSRDGRYWPVHDVWVIDAATSPCIDAGDPKVYPTRERMPHGGRLNIGAYGGTPYASMSRWPLAGDANRDGMVNMKDFITMAQHWLESLPLLPRVLPEPDIIMPVDGTVIAVPDTNLVYEVPASELDN